MGYKTFLIWEENERYITDATDGENISFETVEEVKTYIDKIPKVNGVYQL